LRRRVRCGLRPSGIPETTVRLEGQLRLSR
jgi:hypothetical protein